MKSGGKAEGRRTGEHFGVGVGGTVLGLGACAAAVAVKGDDGVAILQRGVNEHGLCAGGKGRGFKPLESARSGIRTAACWPCSRERRR